MRNVCHTLMYLSTWSLVSDAVWGGGIFLEEVGLWGGL